MKPVLVHPSATVWSSSEKEACRDAYTSARDQLLAGTLAEMADWLRREIPVLAKLDLFRTDVGDDRDVLEEGGAELTDGTYVELLVMWLCDQHGEYYDGIAFDDRMRDYLRELRELWPDAQDCTLDVATGQLRVI